LSGSVDGHVRAYASTDGRVLWDYDMVKPFVTINDVKAAGGSLLGTRHRSLATVRLLCHGEKPDDCIGCKNQDHAQGGNPRDQGYGSRPLEISRRFLPLIFEWHPAQDRLVNRLSEHEHAGDPNADLQIVETCGNENCRETVSDKRRRFRSLRNLSHPKDLADGRLTSGKGAVADLSLLKNYPITECGHPWPRRSAMLRNLSVLGIRSP
jgi:hypothetical protein